MLTGQAKTDYQREYMRKRRSNERSNKIHPAATEIALDPPIALLDLPKRGETKQEAESYRDELARTPLAELEKQGGWIPNWRKVQG